MLLHLLQGHRILVAPGLCVCAKSIKSSISSKYSSVHLFGFCIHVLSIIPRTIITIQQSHNFIQNDNVTLCLRYGPYPIQECIVMSRNLQLHQIRFQHGRTSPASRYSSSGVRPRRAYTYHTEISTTET